MRRLSQLFGATLLLAGALTLTSQVYADGEVRRDPKGQTGISPYNELLAQGRKAFQNGDAEAAAAAFNKAITSDPDNMYGYLLRAQAEMRAGERDKALATVELGRSKKGTEAIQAKLLLLHASLTEAKADVLPPGHKDAGGVQQTTKDIWERVKEMWSAYKVYLTAHTSVPDYKATADERNKQIDARSDRDTKFEPVRARIKAETEKQ